MPEAPITEAQLAEYKKLKEKEERRRKYNAERYQRMKNALHAQQQAQAQSQGDPTVLNFRQARDAE